MLSGPEMPHPHAAYFYNALQVMGLNSLVRRRKETDRILREEGVTYNVYDDPKGVDRPWALDPIPFIISSPEWNVLESGLVQRAELLDKLLCDIYGPGEVFKRGLVPPELLHGHPGFLRACSGIRPRSGRLLHLYAADLARGNDGHFWVMGDRTQAPSGVGYALENRLVLSRVFPGLYRDLQVRRLSRFFRTVRSTLNEVAPHQQANPRTVVLTPGPGNETYFEHAFLANHFGHSLVQGNDLTVRDNRVWLRTLDGLQHVDVILRREDDTFCDPLELRMDSLLGTPGLVQAARCGQVSIVNTLGSGVLENPGMMAFLPVICREMLGEDLKLPSIATWWCGQRQARQYVLDNLEQLVVKPIYPHHVSENVFGGSLSKEQLERLRYQITHQPHLYVGQELASLSTTPTVLENRLEPCRMILRTFLVARNEGYQVMPGGLTRVSTSKDTWKVSNQRGGISKDTWVLASEPEHPPSLWFPARSPIALTRGGGEISSRVADNLFWLGRYAERAEATVRLMREVIWRMLDSELAQHDPYLPALLRAVSHLTCTYPGFVGEGADKRISRPEPELLSVLFDGTRSGSLRYNINAIGNAARSVRDQLSDDTWRVITHLGDELKQFDDLRVGLEICERLILTLSAFAGLCTDSMSRGQAWRFLDLGRRIERALDVLELLRATFNPGSGSVAPLLEALLAITDSLMTYRRRYRLQLQPGAVLDLLLHDESNPRSVGYQLVQLQDLVAQLPRKVDPPHRSAEERLVLEAFAALRLTDLDALADPPMRRNMYHELDQLLMRQRDLLRGLSDTISLSYFTHTQMPQQLVDFS